jgi:hypothetical protein
MAPSKRPDFHPPELDLRWLSPPRWMSPPPNAGRTSGHVIARNDGSENAAKSAPPKPSGGRHDVRPSSVWQSLATRGESIVPLRQRERGPSIRAGGRSVKCGSAGVMNAGASALLAGLKMRGADALIGALQHQTEKLERGKLGEGIQSTGSSTEPTAQERIAELKPTDMGTPETSSKPAPHFEVKLFVRERKVPVIHIPPSAEPPLPPPETVSRGRFFSPPCAARDKVLLSPSLRYGTTALRGRVADLISPGRPFRSPRSKIFSPPKYRGKLLRKNQGLSAPASENLGGGSGGLVGSVECLVGSAEGLVGSSKDFVGSSAVGERAKGAGPQMGTEKRVRFWWLRERKEKGPVLGGPGGGAGSGQRRKDELPVSFAVSGQRGTRKGHYSPATGGPKDNRSVRVSRDGEASSELEESDRSPARRTEAGGEVPCDTVSSGVAATRALQEKPVSPPGSAGSGKTSSCNYKPVAERKPSLDEEEGLVLQPGLAQQKCNAADLSGEESSQSASGRDSPQLDGFLNGALEKLEALALACRLEDLKLAAETEEESRGKETDELAESSKLQGRTGYVTQGKKASVNTLSIATACKTEEVKLAAENREEKYRGETASGPEELELERETGERNRGKPAREVAEAKLERKGGGSTQSRQADMKQPSLILGNAPSSSRSQTVPVGCRQEVSNGTAEILGTTTGRPARVDIADIEAAQDGVSPGEPRSEGLAAKAGGGGADVNAPLIVVGRGGGLDTQNGQGDGVCLEAGLGHRRAEKSEPPGVQSAEERRTNFVGGERWEEKSVKAQIVDRGEGPIRSSEAGRSLWSEEVPAGELSESEKLVGDTKRKETGAGLAIAQDGRSNGLLGAQRESSRPDDDALCAVHGSGSETSSRTERVEVAREGCKGPARKANGVLVVPDGSGNAARPLSDPSSKAPNNSSCTLASDGVDLRAVEAGVSQGSDRPHAVLEPTNPPAKSATLESLEQTVEVTRVHTRNHRGAPVSANAFGFEQAANDGRIGGQDSGCDEGSWDDLRAQGEKLPNPLDADTREEFSFLKELEEPQGTHLVRAESPVLAGLTESPKPLNPASDTPLEARLVRESAAPNVDESELERGGLIGAKGHALEELAQLDWDSILEGDIESCVQHLVESPQVAASTRRRWTASGGPDCGLKAPPREEENVPPVVNLLVGSPKIVRRWTAGESPGFQGLASPGFGGLSFREPRGVAGLESSASEGLRFRETRDVGFVRAVAGWEHGWGGVNPGGGAERRTIDVATESQVGTKLSEYNTGKLSTREVDVHTKSAVFGRQRCNHR